MTSDNTQTSDNAQPYLDEIKRLNAENDRIFQEAEQAEKQIRELQDQLLNVTQLFERAQEERNRYSKSFTDVWMELRELKTKRGKETDTP